MTNTERLEKCKTFADANDIDWLIARVEELEKENSNIKTEFRKLEMLHWEETNKLEKENARLREALGFYAKVSNNLHLMDFTKRECEYLSKVTQDSGEIARQTLEESK